MCPLHSLTRGWISAAQRWDVLRGVYYGNVATQPTHNYFKDYFSRRIALEAMYWVKDISETTTQWRHINCPTIKLAALSTLFQAHLKENMVVVNVKSRAHFTHLGLVSSSSRTSRPLTKSFHFTIPMSDSCTQHRC